MIGREILHYRIVERLGRGGMGVVYKALDSKLDRFVALKFLSPHVEQTEEEKKRFVREAKAASALDHPNICTIFEVNATDDGQMFIAMACYDGQTLKERLERGAVHPREAVEITLQVAEGLAKAHDGGIVHRDVKPANIMLAGDGVVKLLDFGLAKLSGTGGLTKSGTILGTVAYMSPEQARGRPLDRRTDIWSLGVVFYELLAGRQPFRGDSEHAVIESILRVQLEPLTDIRCVAAGALWRIVARALQKEARNRPEDLRAWIKDLRAVPIQDISEDSTIQIVEQSRTPTIAVLPFTNMSADPEQEYFCDGMADEIINALGQVGGLHVAARTSSFAFKGRSEDAREIGQALNVEMLLEGGVRKAGRRLRITAQLIIVADGFHVWSERYDRELADVFAIQDEISQAIVRELKPRLGTAREISVGRERPLVRPPTANLDAYDVYLRGIYCYNRRTRESNDEAIERLEQATVLDPQFALAWAALAYSYIEKLFSYQPRENLEQQALLAVEKSIAIDPNLAEAYVARGLLHWTKSHRFPHGRALAEYRRAIALKPSLAEAHYELARVLWHVGLLDAAHTSLQRAMEINPSDMKAQFRMGWLELHRGNYEQALTFLRKLPSESFVEWSGALVALCLLYLDRKEEAAAQIEATMQRNSGDPAVTSTRAIFLALNGKRPEATAAVQEAIETGKHLGHFHHIACNVAAVYAILNEKELAIDWLEKATGDGFPCYPWLEKDPCLDNVRNEARFVALVESVRRQVDAFRSSS